MYDASVVTPDVAAGVDGNGDLPGAHLAAIGDIGGLLGVVGWHGSVVALVVAPGMKARASRSY